MDSKPRYRRSIRSAGSKPPKNPPRTLQPTLAPGTPALWFGLALAATIAFFWACGAPQIPPGPEPEYERPQVMPWDAGPVVDPFAQIEAEGEWVDEEPAAPSGGGAPPAARQPERPVAPLPKAPAPPPKAPASSAAPTSKP